MESLVNIETVNSVVRYSLLAMKITISILLLVLLILLVYKLIRIALAVYNRRKLSSRKSIWLELTPPLNTFQTPDSTAQLFAVIHGLRVSRNRKDKILGREPVMSFEINSTKSQGIRYLIQVDGKSADTIEKVIAAYIPDSKVKRIDYVPRTPDKVMELKTDNDFIFPLATQNHHDGHDPLSYATSAMANLLEDESISLQIVARPIKLREASRLAGRILRNEDIIRKSSDKGIDLTGLGNALGGAMISLTDTVGDAYNGSTSTYFNNKKQSNTNLQDQVAKRQRPARTLSAFELELMESMNQKIRAPLFRVDIRLLVSSAEPDVHMSALRSALDGYSTPPYQALKTKLQLPIISGYRASLANKRLPNLLNKSSLVLSSAELSSLYHFPSRKISKTDNLITSLSRTLPAPVSLKQGRVLDVILANNIHHGVVTPVGLTEVERERHVYIIGGTGNGKTTMLQYTIVQDMKNGKGLAVVDPHGDMAETLLRHIPEDRIKDVIYFNPDDLAHPIGLNLLELTPGLSGNDLLRDKDMVTESVVSVFRKIFSEEDTGGHRIEYVLRNTIQTALTVKDATLFTVFDLLNDTKYRKSITKKLEDKNLINFWKNELGKAGDMQKVKMAAGITSKIGRFLFSASAKQVLEQKRSTIDFDDIINSGKILICNFSKGLIGEDTSSLFGITVLAKIQLASLRRARMNQAERRSFYLYVDEFQNFATPSFVQMLSEARKYKVLLTMAEQSTSQQKDQQMVSIILANVGTVITFRTGNPQDEKLLLPLFSPFIDQGEISNLSAFNFYAKLSAIDSQEPLSGRTLMLEDTGSYEVYREVIKYSAKTFTKNNAKKKPNRKHSKKSTENNHGSEIRIGEVLTKEPLIDSV